LVWLGWVGGCGVVGVGGGGVGVACVCVCVRVLVYGWVAGRGQFFGGGCGYRSYGLRLACTLRHARTHTHAHPQARTRTYTNFTAYKYVSAHMRVEMAQYVTKTANKVKWHCSSSQQTNQKNITRCTTLPIATGYARHLENYYHVQKRCTTPSLIKTNPW